MQEIALFLRLIDSGLVKSWSDFDILDYDTVLKMNDYLEVQADIKAIAQEEMQKEFEMKAKR